LSNKSSKEQQQKIESLFQTQDNFIVNTINNSIKKDTVYIDLPKTPSSEKVKVPQTTTK
jgi:hypothetical protein